MAYTPEDLNQAQLDILASDLSGNPLLTDIDGTPIHLTNDLPYIIPSINEIYDRLNNDESGMSKFIDEFSGALGRFKANPQLLSDLQKISPNVIEALILQYKEIHGTDLSNPIPLPQGKTVAELLNSNTQSLDKEFTFSDLITDYISLGIIKANQSIDEVVLIIENEFDNNLQISLGTDSAQGLLMTVTDNCTDVINQYGIECNQTFTTDTEIKMFLFNYSGLTKGKGKVIIKTK